MPKKEKWIQKAIKRPGRVRKYIARLYGKKAFNKDGSIKASYLKKAEERAKKTGNTSLVRAINLAQTFKKMK
ncbi:MAG: capsid protein VP2 [Archaeoglobaceae archaeon]|nr:capsid protein VP2 [Archaeoglobaceae archaeon]MDW7990490.1 capsid protein VP2 [Archaeoglobaceae archaeon]